jgi:hypothetical protein
VIGESVGVLRPTSATDRYGNASLTFPSTATHSVDGCAFDPGSSSEDNDGRTAIVVTPTLYAPPGSDITAADRLLVRGLVFEIIGEPAAWVSPFDGQAKGLAISLRRVAG